MTTALALAVCLGHSDHIRTAAVIIFHTRTLKALALASEGASAAEAGGLADAADAEGLTDEEEARASGGEEKW